MTDANPIPDDPEARRRLTRDNGPRYRAFMENLPAEEKAVLAEMAGIRMNAIVNDPANQWPDDPVREHVRRYLQARHQAEQALRARVEELEAAGHRIVTGGPNHGLGWRIEDWRTEDILTSGIGNEARYAAEVARLDPDGTWVNIDTLHPLDVAPQIHTPGVPDSLARLIVRSWIGTNLWLGDRYWGAPDEDIAEFIGWPPEKVREYRPSLPLR